MSQTTCHICGGALISDADVARGAHRHAASGRDIAGLEARVAELEGVAAEARRLVADWEDSPHYENLDNGMARLRAALRGEEG